MVSQCLEIIVHNVSGAFFEFGAVLLAIFHIVAKQEIYSLFGFLDFALPGLAVLLLKTHLQTLAGIFEILC